MGDPLQSLHHALLREISVTGGRDLALRVDDYIGRVMAQYEDKDLDQRLSLLEREVEVSRTILNRLAAQVESRLMRDAV